MAAKTKTTSKAVAAEAAPASKPKGSAPIVLIDKDEAQRIHEEAQQVATGLPVWADPKAKHEEGSIDARMAELHQSRSNT